MNDRAADGAGIFVAAGTTRVSNSTISGNTATTGDASGIKAAGGRLEIVSSLVAGNADSDIAGAGDIVSQGHNLVSTGTGNAAFGVPTDIVIGAGDPGLDPAGLQDNGGPTLTLALVSGSPAIDAGTNPLGSEVGAEDSLLIDSSAKVDLNFANGLARFSAQKNG
ncbi:MAG: choice-of-anchor Q domain-containing protein [Pseudomonadota bacterium]